SVAGGARGVLCAMGVCFECRVTIDGVAQRRACMETVRDGMAIETGSSPVSGLRSPVGKTETLECEVAAVGGGAARRGGGGRGAGRRRAGGPRRGGRRRVLPPGRRAAAGGKNSPPPPRLSRTRGGTRVARTSRALGRDRAHTGRRLRCVAGRFGIPAVRG